MLSIIIPTLNEEEYIPRLLESIKKQSFTDYEIIVADAASTDKTLEIAQSHWCRIVEGGLPGRARNNGARVAQGEFLLFLDADVILPADFLQKALDEFKKKKLDIASFPMDLYPSQPFSQFSSNFYNHYIIFMQNVQPCAAVGILVKKDMFEKLHGFDETIKLAEDYDLARRAVKSGTFAILRSVKLLTSNRRFVRDGWVVMIGKLMLAELHSVFIGPIRSDIFRYRFNHYKDKDNV